MINDLTWMQDKNARIKPFFYEGKKNGKKILEIFNKCSPTIYTKNVRI